MNSVTQSLAPDEWGMYANFIDTELDRNTAQRLYWGKNLPRLKAIKVRYDPKDNFWNPQGVAPIV
jgi:FAD/FMN-containing dehydrogenase